MNQAPAIYLHIPYCKQACHYCDFHFSTGLGTLPRVISAMEIELRERAGSFGSNKIFSIYLGGGTPSILPFEQLEKLFSVLRELFEIPAEAEVTLEANPDDLTREKLEGWKALGINRLSVGVQSLNNRELEWMNRSHRAEEALEGLKLAAGLGFDRISADLIYGVPGQRTEEVLQYANTLLDLGVNHLSAYALTVEERTALAHAIKKGTAPAPPEEAAEAHFNALCNLLRGRGWVHYEVSNWSRPGAEALHNSAYWAGRPYLGIGPSAHSFLEPERSWNVANNTRYALGWENRKPERETEMLTLRDRDNERIMTGLRTLRGLQLDELQPKHREAVQAEAEPFIQRGEMLLEDDILRIPETFWFRADGLAAALFIAPD